MQNVSCSAPPAYRTNGEYHLLIYALILSLDKSLGCVCAFAPYLRSYLT